MHRACPQDSRVELLCSAQYRNGPGVGSFAVRRTAARNWRRVQSMSRLSPLASCAAITVLLYQATLVIAEITSASDMSSDKKPILVVAGGNGFIVRYISSEEGHIDNICL